MAGSKGLTSQLKYRMFEKKRFIWIWTKNENRDIQSFFKIPFLIIRRACDDDLVLLELFIDENWTRTYSDSDS